MAPQWHEPLRVSSSNEIGPVTRLLASRRGEAGPRVRVALPPVGTAAVTVCVHVSQVCVLAFFV